MTRRMSANARKVASLTTADEAQERHAPDVQPDRAAVNSAMCHSFVTEGDHRRAWDMRQTALCEDRSEADIKLQKRGQAFGFVISPTGIIGGLLVALSE